MPEAGRVITGSVRGHRLLGPGGGTRPLSDRTKQALFATLESELGDAWPVAFLDLFAGSGAAGIEALSRGAPLAVFVERDGGAARVIGENLRRTQLAGGTVVRRDVVGYLAGGPGTSPGAPFGAVVVDPPYAETATRQATLERLGDAALGWLRDDAVIVATHFWREAPPDRIGALRLERVRRFGETALSFYRRQPAGEPDAASPVEAAPEPVAAKARVEQEAVP